MECLDATHHKHLAHGHYQNLYASKAFPKLQKLVADDKATFTLGRRVVIPPGTGITRVWNLGLPVYETFNPPVSIGILERLKFWKRK